MNSALPSPSLPEGFTIRELNGEVFRELWNAHAPAIFDNEEVRFNWQAHAGAEEINRWKSLGERMGDPLRINLGLYHHDQFIGWSWGRQESAEAFYMVNSAVLPEYRGRGLYRALMQAMMERAVNSGFQCITSRHHADNNAILVPKLKAGFLITGFEISDRFGTLVNLTWYASPLRRKVMGFRTGHLRPDGETRAAVQLDR